MKIGMNQVSRLLDFYQRIFFGTRKHYLIALQTLTKGLRMLILKRVNLKDVFLIYIEMNILSRNVHSIQKKLQVSKLIASESIDIF